MKQHLIIHAQGTRPAVGVLSELIMMLVFVIILHTVRGPRELQRKCSKHATCVSSLCHSTLGFVLSEFLPA